MEFSLQRFLQLLCISKEGAPVRGELQSLLFPGEPCWDQSLPSENCPQTINSGKDENNHTSNTQKTQQTKSNRSTELNMELLCILSPR